MSLKFKNSRNVDVAAIVIEGAHAAVEPTSANPKLLYCAAAHEPVLSAEPRNIAEGA